MPTKDSTTLYRHVLGDAWRFVTREPRFWVYGFFASFILTGGIYDVAARAWGARVAALVAARLPADFVFPNLRDIAAAASTSLPERLPLALLVALLIALVLVVLVSWLGVVSQGALLSAAAAPGRRSGNLKAAFHAGLHTFWPLLAVDVLSRILLMLIVGLISWPAISVASGGGSGAVAFYLVAFLVGVPLALATLILAFFVMAHVVARDRNLVSALRNAWLTLTRHWLISLEAAALLLAVDAITAIVLAVIILTVSIVFTILLQAAALYGTGAAAVFVTALSGALLLAIIIVLGSALTAFRYALWVRLYARLGERGPVAKIIRLLRAVPSWFHV